MCIYNQGTIQLEGLPCYPNAIIRLIIIQDIRVLKDEILWGTGNSGI